MPDGDQLRLMEQRARNKGISLALAACTLTEAGGHSAGVGVSARAHIGMSKCCAGSEGDEPRFVMRKMGAVCRGGIYCGSSYLECKIGIGARRNLDRLQCMAARLAVLDGPWIIGGDWQGTPEQLAATGWLKLVGGGGQGGGWVHLQREEYGFLRGMPFTGPCCP